MNTLQCQWLDHLKTEPQYRTAAELRRDKSHFYKGSIAMYRVFMKLNEDNVSEEGFCHIMYGYEQEIAAFESAQQGNLLTNK